MSDKYDEKAKKLIQHGCVKYDPVCLLCLKAYPVAKALRESAAEALREMADWIDKGPRNMDAREVASELDRRAAALRKGEGK